MKRFTAGDIHGQLGALKQVLERSKFDYDNDLLIVLGDVCDGGPDTKGCVDEILKIKNYKFILGNHDFWFRKHFTEGFDGEIWLQQGGANTLRSYGAKVKLSEFVSDISLIDTTNFVVPVTHQEFFNTATEYYLLEDKVFVHGGFDPRRPIYNQSKKHLIWDRDLIKKAVIEPIRGYGEIYVGHTTTQHYYEGKNYEHCTNPIWFHNLCMMDCGAGWNGRLAIMDIDSKEFWTSDIQEPCRG